MQAASTNRPPSISIQACGSGTALLIGDVGLNALALICTPQSGLLRTTKKKALRVAAKCLISLPNW
jgi:hypothetical protein